MGEAEALELVKDVDEIYSAKGKTVRHLRVDTSKVDREELLSLLLGPTGNLRAPTARVGRTLLVGFDAATYERTLKLKK